ncbi:MAG: S41 family peptidase [Bacteroidales bacterium]|jgi:carboxyl-terminal processing protease|nr:S41 family peptidase [Bacteroidales bacterium]
MHFNQRKIKISILLTVVVIITSVSFVQLSDREFQIVKNMDIFFNLFREINLFYVDDTDPEKLIEKSIEGMLETLDPYTTFIPESAMEDYKTVTTGQYAGVGLLARNMDNSVVIIDISKGSPADRAGLKIGDALLKVNGESVTGKDEIAIHELFSGAPNTKLQITYQPVSSKKEISKELVREMISIPNVPYYGTLDYPQNKIGYIRLSNFSTNAGKEVKDAFLALKKNHQIDYLVLDVRSNPGGLLLEAVDVVNLFIKRGQEVVSTRGRIKQWDNIYVTRHEPVDTVIPLAVIVNRSSASASEIVAGAIQDLDRGIIVGQRTFGKGLVQATRPLSYNTQLKVTTAKYYIPSGRCIQALDYTHREADGSVGYIPDSLIREYKTLKNKRIVKDGGGVSPDIEALPETLSRIAVTLYMRHLIFNYATLYTQQHDSISSARTFDITDQEYDKFLEYLKDKSFDYQTETESTFLKLKQLAGKEKYLEDAMPEFDALQEKLKHDRFKDLEIHKEDIKELLSEEIVSRYYYGSGKIANTIRKDTQIRAALDVLTETDKYQSILNVK